MSGDERFCGSTDCIGPHEALAVEYVGGGGMVADASFDCPGPAVTFAPEGWDGRTESPIDEQVQSLRYAEPDDDDLPDWYGNFCLSCNHPHPDGECEPTHE